MSLVIGSAAPDFTLYNHTREPVSLESLKGRKTLLVFMPAPFTSTCTGEVCELQDRTSQLNDLAANVVVITVAPLPTNAKWAEVEHLEFPILSDFWPHGAVSRAYETFNETFGVANRSTFVLNEEAFITDVIATDEIAGAARSFEDYVQALS